MKKWIYLQRYLALILLAMLASACETLNVGGAPTATPVPYARYTVEDAFAVFARNGLVIDDFQQATDVQRDGPRVLQDRWVFSVPRIAPAGGQIVIFGDASQQGEWVAYIDRLRAVADTRRTVIYTYFQANMMLQLNASLTNAEAAAFEAALRTLP